MSAGKQIRVGIIGCGVIAPCHIGSYLKLPGVKVVHLCDKVIAKAEKLAAEHGIEKVSQDYGKLLADPEVDAVSICTDHASHSQIAIDALEAGKHVICEKSLASSKEKLDAMLAAARRHPELVFSGVFQHRFDAGYNYVRSLVSDGVFGTMLTANLNVLCLRTNEYYNADAWRGTWAEEGGALLINQSIHFIDMIAWLTGGVESVSACYANLHHQGVIECEDTAAAAVVYRNGALGTISATSASPITWEPTISFNGTAGSMDIRNGELLRIDLKDKDLEEKIRSGFRNIKEEGELLIKSKDYYGSGHPQQMNNFIQAIRGEASLKVPVESAAHAPDIVLSIYESFNTGKRVRITH